MIIYNTTYHAHDKVAAQFVEWVKKEYLPKALANGKISEPRLTVVLNAESNEGKNYSLQFRCQSLDILQDWYTNVGDDLVVAMTQKFGHDVAGFSTLLEEIDL